ncbi:hypothetical protein LAZ67_14002195, partial [Cordylochernes scorpioides]
MSISAGVKTGVKKNTCKHFTRNPTVFSGNGTENCGKWMKDYERIARSNCWDATMKLANAPFFLEGTAGQWYDNNEEGMDSWDMFKEMFSRTFDNSGVLLRRAKDNLQSRAQKSTESCESYIQDVLSLCRQVNPDRSQGEKVAHLMKGVVEDVYQVILIKEIDTVEAFVDWCRKVEACKQRRIGKPRFERLPNVASIEQPNSSSLEDLIRRIVREEIKSALHFESIVPEVNSLKKIIHEEVERNLTPIAEQGPYYREQRRYFEGPAKPTPYYQQQSPTRLTTARRKTDEWRTVDNIPVCFQCGRPGHVARYCRERRGMVDRQPPGRYHPVQNGPRTIYNSDETPGRTSYRSPSPYPGRGRSPAERRPSISPSRRSGRSPYPAKLSQNIVDVTIDDKTFPALVDSGASFSVISDHFRQQHKKTMFSDAGMTLRVADGKYLVSRGRCTLRLEINGLVQPFEFIVLPSCSHDIILGWDFLEASRAIIDCGSAEILLEKAELPEDSSSIFQTVAADDSFIIPAGSTKQINVISETILGVSDVVMEPSRILFLEHDLMVPASIFAVQHGKGRIWITNIGTCDRTVPKGMCIGEIQVLEEGQLAVIGDASDTNRQEILGQENSPNIASMISPDLSMLERTRICSILGSVSGLFEFNKFPSNLTSTAKHKINTEDHPPFKRRPYRVSQVERQTIQNEVDKMLKGGIVQLSESPWSSPVVLVKKKNGSWRFCVDYRHLNKITKKDVYPLPRIDDTLDCLRGASYYSSMDLRSGYWQIEVDEADREKTAFITPDGLYEFKVMPFGLCNSPATFERMMDTLLRGLKWSMCLCYLDDIIVFSPTFDEHVRRLELVLRCLSKAGLVLNPDKCLFGTKRLSIFGHLVDGEGVHPDPGKVDAMSKFPTPKSLTDVRSFIGMCSSYRRFIKNFAQKAEPLHRLLRKDTRFEWGPDQRQAYESLKLALASEPVLAHFDEKYATELHTDASGFGIGAVLVQVQGGSEKPIGYASRTLSTAEKNYSTTERECLAAIWAIGKFRPYLFGRSFTIVTDHHSLCWLSGLKDPSGRLARWASRLQEYNVNVVYKNGRKHQDADCLSRNPIEANNPGESGDDIPTLAALTDIVAEQRKDPNARKETASLNLEATTDDPELLKRVITGDETWIYGFDFETTQQASEWRFKNEPRPKKARKAPSKVKVMLTVFFNYQGIVHHEFQQQGSTITSDSYLGVLRRLREAIRQKRPELWRSKSWILHHDNTPAETALKISKFLQDHSTSVFPQPPYSPDLAPCDFFLFGKLKKKLKGRKFQSIEEIKVKSKKAMEVIPKTDYQRCFADWKKRWLRRSRRLEGLEPRFDFDEKNKPIRKMSISAGVNTGVNTCKHLTRNPTVFSGNGTEDCGKWMKDYERIARSNCWDATMKLANAPFFLEGTAGLWYDNNEEGMDSWDMFKEMFSRTFDNSGVLLRRAKDNLQSRAQKSTESCESYIQDVLSLCRQVNPDMSKEEKVAHLMKGVVEDVYQVILIKEIDTVEAFVDWCRKVEACKQRRIGKPRFERLPNVASIEQPNSSSLEDLIRRIVREEIKSALHSEPIVPEVNSLKKMIHEEVEKNLTPIAQQGPYYQEQRRQFEGPAKPPPYYQQQSPTRLTTARRKTDEWRTVDNIPVCFQCGRPGHVARYCRERRGMMDRQPPGKNHPVQNGPRTIYNSNETPGRASYRSPSPYPGRGRSPAERRPSISPSRRSGRSPYPAKLSQNIVDVTIDDKTFPALVDSGASFSVISDHFRQQHKKTMFSDAGMTLRVADGKYIVSRDRCTLRLEINGLVQPFEFIVLPSCSHDIILGWDFLEASRAIIDCGSAEILLEKSELPEDSSSIFQTVAADDSFIIPAGSTKQINVISEAILGVSDVVMEPSRILFLERDLMVPASIFAVQHGKGRIWITNIGTCDRTVPKGMCIGEIQVLEEGQLAVIGDASDTNRQGILGQENSPNIASMISPDLSMLERTRICSILGSFSGLFEFNKFPSNLTSTAKHKINTEDHPPIKRRPYRVSHVERQTIQNEVDKMLKGGIVQLSESPWSSPVVLVKKKNGSWRFCVDYRHLNKITKKDVYPLPRIDDTLDCLRGASYYSSMDLRSGYWQIEVDEADREKTAFITPDGLYEFKVMPFGLCNAPATFERMMDTLLRGLKWSMCLCYLDDIIVFSPTFDEHVRRLELVLRCLSKAGLVLNPDKCLFGTKRLSIFGHLVDGEGVHPDPGKVDAMSKFPTPKSLTDVRSFIGMCSYYRRFIKNFAQKAEPLHKLLRKDTRFEWGPDQRQAYESLKLALASEPVLAHFDEKKHQDADCLSRNPIEANNPGESEDDIPTLAALTDIVAEQRKDPVIVRISEECSRNDQNRFKIINGALYKRNFDPVGQPWLLVIPRHLRPDVLRSLHDNPTAGHLGLAKTHDRIRRKYFWPGLLRSIRKYVGHCRECQRRKHAPLRPPGLLQPIPPTSVPFQRVGIDLLGRFPISHLGNKWIIVCTDYLTRYAITRALPLADAQQVAKFVLEDVVLKHGAPREKIIDRGRVFQSKLISELTGLCSSAQRFTTAYHPQTNGLTERLNKTLADMMSMYVDVEQKEWDVILPFITFAYNTAKQDTTGFTPFSLIHGREAETTLDTLFPLLKDEDQEDYNREIVTRAEETRQLARLHTLRAQEGNKRLYDAKHREVSYQPGDKVWIFIPVRKIGISEKLIKRYFGPYRVTRRISDVTYEVESLDTTNRRRKPKEIVHVVRMKNYRDPDEQLDLPEDEPAVWQRGRCPFGEEGIVALFVVLFYIIGFWILFVFVLHPTTGRRSEGSSGSTMESLLREMVEQQSLMMSILCGNKKEEYLSEEDYYEQKEYLKYSVVEDVDEEEEANIESLKSLEKSEITTMLKQQRLIMDLLFEVEESKKSQVEKNPVVKTEESEKAEIEKKSVEADESEKAEVEKNSGEVEESEKAQVDKRSVLGTESAEPITKEVDVIAGIDADNAGLCDLDDATYTQAGEIDKDSENTEEISDYIIDVPTTQAGDIDNNTGNTEEISDYIIDVPTTQAGEIDTYTENTEKPSDCIIDVPDTQAGKQEPKPGTGEEALRELPCYDTLLETLKKGIYSFQTSEIESGFRREAEGLEELLTASVHNAFVTFTDIFEGKRMKYVGKGVQCICYGEVLSSDKFSTIYRIGRLNLKRRSWGQSTAGEFEEYDEPVLAYLKDVGRPASIGHLYNLIPRWTNPMLFVGNEGKPFVFYQYVFKHDHGMMWCNQIREALKHLDLNEIHSHDINGVDFSNDAAKRDNCIPYTMEPLQKPDKVNSKDGDKEDGKIHITEEIIIRDDELLPASDTIDGHECRWDEIERSDAFKKEIHIFDALRTLQGSAQANLCYPKDFWIVRDLGSKCFSNIIEEGDKNNLDWHDMNLSHFVFFHPEYGGENYEIPTNNCIAKLTDFEISRLVENDDPNPNVFYENVPQVICTHNEIRDFNSACEVHTESIEETSTQITAEESQRSHSETEDLDELGVPYLWLVVLKKAPQASKYIQPYDCSKPADEASRPADDTSGPADDTSGPADDTSGPADDTSRPADDTSRSANDTSRPADDTSRSENDTSRSANDTSRSANDTSRPADHTYKPSDHTSKPSDDTSGPSDLQRNKRPSKESHHRSDE